ncbi:MAG: FMN-binding protein [Bifidobacteriaceae bacterium]|jgi:major membrane immunogen (membrane-anchored lipoprotein)|nr:FMN-binding protein [Bifidobacteriaceae bacterium]
MTLMIDRHRIARSAGGLTALAGAAWLLAACSPAAPPFDPSIPLTDGVFEGESEPDEQGAFGRATITISGGRITASEFVVVQANGSVKAEDYGKDSDGQIANQQSYKAAQKAVAAFDVYARELLETGVPADVDVVSGATIAYRQFLTAATNALVESQEAGQSPSPEQ